MLEVIKSLNNNIVLAQTIYKEEVVLFGNGIGFHKKKGDHIDYNEASKIFQYQQNHYLIKIIDDISPEILALTKEIIELGEKELNLKFHAIILLTLADHLQMAIARDKQKIIIESPLHWEVPCLYHKEYLLGKIILDLIEERLSLRLPENEASFIALHFINAQNEVEQTMNQTLKNMQIIKSIIETLKNFLGSTFDATTFTYSRFITHLQYFVARQSRQIDKHRSMDEFLKNVIQSHYAKSYTCARVIQDFLKEKHHWQITDDELAYLTIHLEQLIKDTDSMNET